jgi:hypothetical protein
LFTKSGEPWFCIAGIWRADDDVGEAFTMLAMPPGPEIASEIVIGRSPSSTAPIGPLGSIHRFQPRQS